MAGAQGLVELLQMPISLAAEVTVIAGGLAPSDVLRVEGKAGPPPGK